MQGSQSERETVCTDKDLIGRGLANGAGITGGTTLSFDLAIRQETSRDDGDERRTSLKRPGGKLTYLNTDSPD